MHYGVCDFWHFLPDTALRLFPYIVNTQVFVSFAFLLILQLMICVHLLSMVVITVEIMMRSPVTRPAIKYIRKGFVASEYEIRIRVFAPCYWKVLGIYKRRKSKIEEET